MARVVNAKSSRTRAKHVVLSERDSLRVLDLLENPPSPTERLILAIKADRERETKLSSLRTMLHDSIKNGGQEEEIDAALEVKAAELAKVGF